jgi:hypothetical protein
MPPPSTPISPGEGERRAQRGYVSQYDKSAAAIYESLRRDDLMWLGVADRSAGIADDLVLGLRGGIVGHQFKTSKYPTPFRLHTLLLGASGELKRLARAWQILTASFPTERIEIRLVTNDYPSPTDSISEGEQGHSAAFLQELEQYPDRSVAEWQSTRWGAFVDALAMGSGLDGHSFSIFFRSFRILYGPAADFVQAHRRSPEVARQTQEIAALIPRLVADLRDMDRWTRTQLLDELEWRDTFAVRRSHQFPVGTYVQRNVVTERALREAISKADSGYISLVGPPGSGKSTLLQSSLSNEPALVIVRYLAFVPGEGQGIGRGEAEDFLDDVNAQLKRSGLSGPRFRDATLSDRRDHLEKLLQQAGVRFQQESVRTFIVVDGLDHVPREEKPVRSLLAELPLPSSIPAGVLIILGTQRLDLNDLKPAVQTQAALSQRYVTVAPLSRDAVGRMAELLGLDLAISRERLWDLSGGHPLVTRYLIEALRAADAARRQALLAGEFSFEGDIDLIYSSAWRAIQEHADACDVMGYLARAEGPIQPHLIAQAVSPEAVERALQTTRHLLNRGPQGWSVFHNSFRLFILSKPRLRFGEPDPHYSTTIYSSLADLARMADPLSPQRWLELRYLARAHEHSRALALAQPVVFRNQLADGRPAGDILADIRLAFGAASKSGANATTAFRLLLARDEIERRAGALKDAPAVVTALLATDDIDGALAFSEATNTAGYEVVDALLAAGDIDRARTLFDKIEPVSGMDGDRALVLGSRENELREWADRVFNFRDAEQICEAVEQLSREYRGQRGRLREADPSIAERLRFAVARAAIAAQPISDPLAIGGQLKVEEVESPRLLIESGLGLQAQGVAPLALKRLSEAATNAAFAKVSNTVRRRVSLAALQLGDAAMARNVFATLEVPTVATLDESIGETVPEGVALAIMEYARLATILGEPILQAPPSKRQILQPLQHHGNAIGVLLGRINAGASPPKGEVARVARQTLAFLKQVTPVDPGDFYAARQIWIAAPILGRALVQVAALSGETEFAAVVAEFDRSFNERGSRNRERIDLRRQITAEIYEWDGDVSGACARLEALVQHLQEATPERQVESLAELAASFAQVGNEARAKELIRQIHCESLGYATAPKKDPQYAFWRDLFERANAADPSRRIQRLQIMMRQLHGMTQTEGEASAFRMAATVLNEAAMASAASGLAAARDMAEWGILKWEGIVSALLVGVVRRRSDLAGPCAVAWSSLAMPYYEDASYRRGQLKDPISVYISAAKDSDLFTLVELMRTGIEAESRVPVRAIMLESLRDAAVKRGLNNDRLENALARWRAEAPIKRDATTPQRYDEVTSLAELEERLTRENSELLDYQAASAYARLVSTASTQEAHRIFEHRPGIQKDTRARFALVDRALADGEVTLARELVDGYLDQVDEDATWSYWTGGGKLRYFQARVRLDGDIVHGAALRDFVGALAAGREYTGSLLPDVEDVFSVIAATPDWPAMWECLAEQLSTTREYAIGRKFEVTTELTDEELITVIYRWALSLHINELRMRFRSGALRLLAVDGGASVFARLSRELIEGEADEPAEALQLLVLDLTDAAAVQLTGAMSGLIDHPDFAVAAAASRLCVRWGIRVTRQVCDLPAFYRIELDADLNAEKFERPSLVDSRTGAMLVEDPLGWTFAFRRLVRALARKGPSIQQIRHRCWMLISEWGGLPAFGQTATEKLEADLARIDMRLTYLVPHVAGAARALRYVAGEMRKAGLLDNRDEPWILEMMGYPAVRLPVLLPSERPPFVVRPSLDPYMWSKDQQQRWVATVSDDIRPIVIGSDTILSEITRFHFKYVGREFTVDRMRVPFLDAAPSEDSSSWTDDLPGAIWVDEIVPLSDEPAVTVVRYFSQSGVPEIPSDMLVICPVWLRRLGWRRQPENWLNYLDRVGQLVAKVVWWRDGAPGDLQDEVVWSEGVLVVVTPEGRGQLQAGAGHLRVQVRACRATSAEAGSGERRAEIATARE